VVCVGYGGKSEGGVYYEGGERGVGKAGRVSRGTEEVWSLCQ